MSDAMERYEKCPAKIYIKNIDEKIELIHKRIEDKNKEYKEEQKVLSEEIKSGIDGLSSEFTIQTNKLNALIIKVLITALTACGGAVISMAIYFLTNK